MKTNILILGLVAALAALPLSADGTSPQREGQKIAAKFPFEKEYVQVDGSHMAYVDEGDGPVVLFIHGNPTSSYIWRNIIPHISKTHRTIAIDLIGMGDSDKPDIDYTFQDHYAYVEGFIEELDLKNITLVLHDWGGGLGSYYAANHPGNVQAVALMEAAAPPVLPIPDWAMVADPQVRETFQSFRDPEIGPAIIVEQNGFVEDLLPQAVKRALSDAEMDAYRAPFKTKASRKPILVWPNEIPIEGEPARNVHVMQTIGEWLLTSEHPKLVLYADPGMTVSPQVADVIAKTYRNVETRYVGAGIHYIQEDHPHVIGRNLSDWLRNRVFVHQN